MPFQVFSSSDGSSATFKVSPNNIFIRRDIYAEGGEQLVHNNLISSPATSMLISSTNNDMEDSIQVVRFLFAYMHMHIYLYISHYRQLFIHQCVF